MNAFEWSRLYFQNEDRELTSTKSTMAALYSYADFTTLECYPSQAKLANVTALHIRTVRRHIQRNIERGWLDVVEPGNSFKKSTRYRLTVPHQLRTAMTGVANQLGTSMTGTTDTDVRSTADTDALLTTNTNTHELTSVNTTPDPLGGPGIGSPSNPTTQHPTPDTDVRSTTGDDDPFYEPKLDLIERALAAGPMGVEELSRQTGLTVEFIVQRAAYPPLVFIARDDDPFAPKLGAVDLRWRKR
ncbi:helix-turn-helix domain-containing protein [Mycobacteroides abscessus]